MGKPSSESYWDNVAREAKSERNIESNEDWISFKNWTAEYADTKAKDLLLRTFERFVPLHRCTPILDVGCGPGKWTRLFAEKGFLTIGIDASVGMIDLAKERINTNSTETTEFCLMDLSMLGFREATFGFINCVTVLQHIPIDKKWRHAIREFARVTKPQGYILLYEMAPLFTLKKQTRNLRIRTLKEYEIEFAKAGAQLIFSMATDISFLLTVFNLKKFSSTFNRNEAYFYWTRKRRIISLARILSIMSKATAKVAKQIDYNLAETPLGILSPLRILLFCKI